MSSVGSGGSLPSHPITSVCVPRFASLLKGHPDPSLISYVLHGLSEGFSIGVEGPVGPGSTRNNRSALDNAAGVDEAITHEVSQGFLAGPFPHRPFPRFHCSPVSAVGKPGGKTRLLLDMSSPRDDNLNVLIDSDRYTCRYSSFDNGVRLVVSVGRGAYLAKLDVQDAFRLCPVRQSECYLLGFRWRGCYYVYLRLPYGFRSSPCTFNVCAIYLLIIT